MKDETNLRCDWEPQGNGHFLTTCGKLIFDRAFSPTRDKRCRICGKPFTRGTYINMHEEVRDE